MNKELQVEYDNVAALVEELVPPDEDYTGSACAVLARYGALLPQ